MTRLWANGVPITVQTTLHGQPRQFVWARHTYHVAQIHQCWQVATDWWEESGYISRTYWALVTQEGLLAVLYQDLVDGAWYLSKTYD